MSELVKNQRFFGANPKTFKRNNDKNQRNRARRESIRATWKKKMRDPLDEFFVEQQRRLACKLESSVHKINEETDARSMAEEVFEHRK